MSLNPNRHTPYGRTITRYPYNFQSTPEAIYNSQRLPDPDQYQNLELAYRDNGIEEPKVARALYKRLIGILLLLSVAAFFIVALLPMIPLIAQITGILSLGLCAITWKLFSYRLTFKTMTTICVVVVTSIIGVNLLHLATNFRNWGAPLLAATAIGALLYVFEQIRIFINGWILAMPQLRPESIKDQTPIKCIPLQAILTAAITLGGTAMISLYSSGYAMIFVCIVIITNIYKTTEYSRQACIKYFQQSAHFVTLFFTYNNTNKVVPGLWRPTHSHKARTRMLLISTSIIMISLTVSLNCYFPADLAFASDAFEKIAPAKFIQQTPNGWLQVAIAGISKGQMAFALCLIVALIIAIFLPVFTLSILMMPFAQVMIKAENTYKEIDKDNRPQQQWYIDRMAQSVHQTKGSLGEDIIEKEHLFLGIEPNVNTPILLDEKILNEHAYITGETGSGKTSLGIMPLLLHFLRKPLQTNDPDDAAPLIILDLKGDPALFNMVREEVEKRDKAFGNSKSSFRFFTPEPKRDSHIFNPFASMNSENRSLTQLCELLMDSLNLNHGEGYGRSYFSRRSRSLLLQALQQDPKPNNFDELFETVTKHAKKDTEDAFELLSVIHSLSQYKQLSTDDVKVSPEHKIHMPTVLEERQVVYFWLPSATESISVREIAKLGLYSILTAAIDRQASGQPKRQAYLFIDEFQRIAGENFKVILEQARSFGLSAILANQTPQDLKTNNGDLRPTIQTNTRFKQYFSITGTDDMADTIQTSGEEISLIQSWGETISENNSSSSFNTSEKIKPRITCNDLLQITDHPQDSLIKISRGSGYTQFAGHPVHVRSLWPMHLSDYKRLMDCPWPEIPELKKSTQAQEAPIEIDNRSRKVAADQAAKLLDLFQKKTQELGG